MPQPATHQPMPSGGPVHPIKATGDSSARIILELPADARVFIDGVIMPSRSERRVFESPKLATGQHYLYTVKAEYEQAGKPVKVSKVVRVSAGAEVKVSLYQDPSIAAR